MNNENNLAVGEATPISENRNVDLKFTKSGSDEKATKPQTVTVQRRDVKGEMSI
jgi:hypothetical protein